MAGESLNRLAVVASQDPWFLGYRLSAFAETARLDDAALADFLETDCDGLTKLRLCRNWRAGTALGEDACIYVSHIARAIPLFEARLVRILESPAGTAKAIADASSSR